MDRDKFFIGGEWVRPAGTRTLSVISPATEAVIATVPDATVADVDRAIAAARHAFDEGPWPRMAQEEIFGPVLAAIPYDDIDDAVAIANHSDYGLAGTVWTADVATGLDVARRVRTGTYGINGLMPDFGAPAGGFQRAGIGRELGPEGLEAYLELENIVLPPDCPSI